MKKGISLKKLESFEKDFDSNIANKIAMNAVTNNGINNAALNREVYNNNQNAFSIEVKAGDVCNQKQSGR